MSSLNIKSYTKHFYGQEIYLMAFKNGIPKIGSGVQTTPGTVHEQKTYDGLIRVFGGTAQSDFASRHSNLPSVRLYSMALLARIPAPFSPSRASDHCPSSSRQGLYCNIPWPFLCKDAQRLGMPFLKTSPPVSGAQLL